MKYWKQFKTHRLNENDIMFEYKKWLVLACIINLDLIVFMESITWNYCFSLFCPRYSLHVTSLWVFAGWLSFFFSVCVVPSFTYDTCFAIKYASYVEVCITIHKSSRCKCVFTSCFLAICLKLFQIIFQIANSFYKQVFVFDFV